MSPKDPQLVTFGCRLNTYESEVMRGHANNAGLDEAIIFNTCAVTKEAERQARQAIRRARRENPEARIIVTGCSAQIDPQTYAEMEEVDIVLGNDLKLQANSWSFNFSALPPLPPRLRGGIDVEIPPAIEGAPNGVTQTKSSLTSEGAPNGATQTKSSITSEGEPNGVTQTKSSITSEGEPNGMTQTKSSSTSGVESNGMTQTKSSITSGVEPNGVTPIIKSPPASGGARGGLTGGLVRGLPVHAKILVNDIMAVKETAGHLIKGVEGHARAFIQVQNGCDHRCTFCIIPYGRGNSRSVPIGEITAQVRKLVENGCNEIVMTGVDVTSYGADLPGQPSLGQMIRRVLALVPELPRLRLSSLDPVEIDADLWRLIAEEPRLMPHLHMSLQAGDDMILKRMKRRHLRSDAIEMCRKAREYRPDMAFGADIIAGFPTETEEMFQNTLNIVEECDLTFLHVFPYSERPGTPAAKMPPVEPKIRKERAARLRNLGDKQVDKFLKFHVKQKRQVIVEKGNIGRTEHFASVELDRPCKVGSLVDVMTSEVREQSLTGKVL